MPIGINGSGTITGISVGGLPDGIVDTDMIAAKAATKPKLGNGAILQCLQTVKSDQFTVSANASNFFDISGLSVDITMTAASNKVLVLFTTTWTGQNGQRGSFRVRRGSTDIGVGDARGSRTRAFFGSIQTSSTNQCLPVAGQFLDTPGTGTHTYKLQVGGESGVGTLTVNSNQSDGDSGDKFVGISTITVLEVAA